MTRQFLWNQIYAWIQIQIVFGKTISDDILIWDFSICISVNELREGLERRFCPSHTDPQSVGAPRTIIVHRHRLLDSKQQKTPENHLQKYKSQSFRGVSNITGRHQIYTVSSEVHQFIVKGNIGVCSCLCGPDVDERGQQQELWRFVQKHQVVAAKAVVMHPEAVDLERRRIMMLVSVEERRSLQWVPVQ